jgi:cyclopropane fatty-acyl-phospholipid synthase-like methyltransferase
MKDGNGAMMQGKTWNNTYSKDNKVWGDKPSELALFAGNYLKESEQFKASQDIFLLDLGCGYGRDAIFLAQYLLSCHILGLDNSEKAIEMARESIPKELEKRIELLCYDFSHVIDKYDVIVVSNLYHFLKPDERIKLRETIKRCLKKNGLLFLSTSSVRDPQHFGLGTPVENEPNTFQDERYIYFCTRQDMEKEFDFVNISALFERDFREERTTGAHHHISWILMGKMR